MDFGLSEEISIDLLKKSEIITEISQSMENYWKDRNYGNSVQTFVIGIICVSQGFDFFFKIRKKYTKSKKTLAYDVKLDHQKFKTADKQGIQQMVGMEIINSLSIIEELKVPDFDLIRFKGDLEIFFKEKFGVNKL